MRSVTRGQHLTYAAFIELLGPPREEGAEAMQLTDDAEGAAEADVALLTSTLSVPPKAADELQELFKEQAPHARVFRVNSMQYTVIEYTVAAVVVAVLVFRISVRV